MTDAPTRSPRRRSPPAGQRRQGTLQARVEALAESGVAPEDIAAALRRSLGAVRAALVALGFSGRTGRPSEPRPPRGDHPGHLADLRAAYPAGAAEIAIAPGRPVRFAAVAVSSGAGSPALLCAESGISERRVWR